MGICFFVSDLHGDTHRYQRLFDLIEAETPDAVFLGGDLLPNGSINLGRLELVHHDFVSRYLEVHLQRLKSLLKDRYPRVFVILGNDDARSQEAVILSAATRGVWEYAHDRCILFGVFDVYGYAFIPPTPFMLKDWERYDVSRHVDPGCISPEEGHRTVPEADNIVRYATIRDDLDKLTRGRNLERAIMLMHTPPYDTTLDRAALDGRVIDHAPVDVHVGSIAVRRFIEEHQPLVTLHGHIHESARLTGAWSQTLGATHCYSAAHDGPELALVRFDPAAPASATRTLIDAATPRSPAPTAGPDR